MVDAISMVADLKAVEENIHIMFFKDNAGVNAEDAVNAAKELVKKKIGCTLTFAHYVGEKKGQEKSRVLELGISDFEADLVLNQLRTVYPEQFKTSGVKRKRTTKPSSSSSSDQDSKKAKTTKLVDSKIRQKQDSKTIGKRQQQDSKTATITAGFSIGGISTTHFHSLPKGSFLTSTGSGTLNLGKFVPTVGKTEVDLSSVVPDTEGNTVGIPADSTTANTADVAEVLNNWIGADFTFCALHAKGVRATYYVNNLTFKVSASGELVVGSTNSDVVISVRSRTSDDGPHVWQKPNCNISFFISSTAVEPLHKRCRESYNNLTESREFILLGHSVDGGDGTLHSPLQPRVKATPDNEVVDDVGTVLKRVKVGTYVVKNEVPDLRKVALQHPSLIDAMVLNRFDDDSARTFCVDAKPAARLIFCYLGKLKFLEDLKKGNKRFETVDEKRAVREVDILEEDLKAIYEWIKNYPGYAAAVESILDLVGADPECCYCPKLLLEDPSFHSGNVQGTPRKRTRKTSSVAAVQNASPTSSSVAAVQNASPTSATVRSKVSLPNISSPVSVVSSASSSFASALSSSSSIVRITFSATVSKLMGACIFASADGSKVVVCDGAFRYLVAGNVDSDGDLVCLE